jgi:pyrroline-5-carboxylate reductase
MLTLGFIGGGRITRIICKGLAFAEALPSTAVYDNSSDAAALIEKTGSGIKSGSSLDDVLKSDIVVLALHPAALPETLAAIRSRIGTSTIVLSLSPKISIQKTQEFLGGHRLVARMNPNAPSVIGKGFNPIAFSSDFDENRKKDVLAVFAPLGRLPVVDDKLIDAFAVITAMGATYLDYQIGLLKEMAGTFGIPEDLARDGIISLAEGIAETVLSGAHGENPYDLVPVRPLKDIEDQVRTAYRTVLQQRFDMLTK